MAERQTERGWGEGVERERERDRDREKQRERNLACVDDVGDSVRVCDRVSDIIILSLFIYSQFMM